MNHRIAASMLVLAGVGSTFGANADWPIARHDVERTGTATGVSNLTAPLPYWRYFLGGAADERGVIARDLNSDGEAELYLIGGGRVSARKPDGQVLWDTPLLGATKIVALTDLNGDSALDLVAQSLDQVLVLNPLTGSVEWSEAKGEMGTIGDVRVGDMNGDGLPDIVIQECGCCKVKSNNTGFAYSFATGLASPQKLWQLPAIQCAGFAAMTVADVDGDGKQEFVHARPDRLQVLKGSDASVMASSPVLGAEAQRSMCVPVNVDGMPGEELVCILNAKQAPAGTGHRVYLLKYQVTPSPTMALAWQAEVGEVDGEMSIGASFVHDLDGDGSLEIALSGTTASGALNTYVFDAGAGTPLASLPNAQFFGVADLGTASRATILTIAGTQLDGWRFDRTANPALSAAWTLADETPQTEVDWVRLARSPLANEVLSLDLTSDGSVELLTASTTATGSSLNAYNTTAATPSVVSSFQFSNGVEVLHAWTAPKVNRPYPQVVVTGTNGLLTVHDNQLVATSRPGIRISGYYANGGWKNVETPPVVAALQGAAHSVVVTDSRQALVRIDPRDATLVVGPPARWARVRSTAPAIVPGLDGAAAGITCRRTNPTSPPTYELVALRADGSEIWSANLPDAPLSDVVYGKLNSDAVPDLFVQWAHPSDQFLHTRALNGANGNTLWDATPVMAAGNNLVSAGASVLDWNGDGVDDLLYQFYATRVVSGANGAELTANNLVAPYFLPSVFDVDGDGQPEVTLHGSLQPARTLRNDLTTQVWVGPNQRPFPYGAIVTCPNQAPFLVESSSNLPARVDITTLSGASAGSRSSLVLADGRVFADEAAATAAGAELGELTSASGHQDLAGAGRPSVLFGASDGWLYAVDPCSGALDFSYRFASPVGATVYGDTDGDGLDEVLVSVADGFLYGMKQPPVAPPSDVIDTDPDNNITTTDVDDIVTADKLSGAWSAVPDAEGYEVAVAKADGSEYVSSPAWQDVGDVTSASVSGLPLVHLERYVFAVRAKKSGSVSPDVSSDGVTVYMPDAGVPDSGEGGLPEASLPDAQADAGLPIDIASDGVIEGGGCACTSTRRTTGSPFYLALLALLPLSLWRRRRSN